MRTPLLATLLVLLTAGLFITQTAAAAEQPLQVDSGGAALHGVIDLPDGDGPFPAVLILPGSGPTDQDGNSLVPPGTKLGMHHSPYKQIAAGLNAAGYAVVRMNKRDLPPTSALARSIDDYVADAQQVLAALRTRADIDSNHLVVMGHSEGGMIALKTAEREHLAGLILTGTPAVPMREVITDQAVTANKAAGASEEQLQKVKQLQDGFYQALRDYKGPEPLHYLNTTLPESSALLLASEIDFDPIAAAKRIDTPTLVLQGGDDFNVAPENGPLLAAALPNGALKQIPEMSHVFTQVKDRTVAQLQTTPDTPLDPEVIPALVDWLNAHVAAARM